MPPTAVVAVDQLVPPLLLPEPDELDEQPAASRAAAATPASAKRCDDLNSSSWKLPRPEVDCGYLRSLAAVPEEVCRPTYSQLRVQVKRS
jgi:hypothetical protein